MKDLIESHPFEWRVWALKLAERTAPKTKWESRPIYSHNHERLSLANMQEQLVDQSLRVRALVLKAVLQWATTGRWPTVRNAASFFLRKAIQEALLRYPTDIVESPETKADAFSGPPWTMDEAVWLADSIVMAWYIRECKYWAEYTAKSEFASQESSFQNQHPYD